MNTTTPPLNTIPAPSTSLSSATAERGFFLVALVLVYFALSPALKPASPAPDGGYPNHNTAEGANALKSVSSSGTDNTAVGFGALQSNTNGQFNTAIGSQALYSDNTPGNIGANTAIGGQALYSNTTGPFNTATGVQALASNTTGFDNTGIGFGALAGNTTGGDNTAIGFEALGGNGSNNTAIGSQALFLNTIGSNNTATGFGTLSGCGECFASLGDNNTATGAFALGGFADSGSNNTATGASAMQSNSTGTQNTATGVNALNNNETGNNNTATGVAALNGNFTGSNNTAEGFQALLNSNGSNNIGLGANAGINLTTGNNNIVIGASGTAGESNTIRIGKDGVHKAAYMGGIRGATVASGVTVIVGASGHLGTIVSSQRFKDEIKPMDKASEAILALKPVTFRYKHELDPDGIPQFGLVAEDVAKVNPDLVARDEEGKVYTVRYEAVNAMLLNEFLKEHGRVEEQERKLKKQQAMIVRQQEDFDAKFAQQQKQIEALMTDLQRVNAQLGLTKPAPQIVLNNQ